MTNDRSTFRADVLRNFGASTGECAELLAYNTPSFELSDAHTFSYPLNDEPFVSAWREYAEIARARGFAALSNVFVQFSFPIQSGIGRSQEYIDATERGLFPRVTTGVSPLQAPEAIRLDIHRGLGGAIPLITTSNRQDFENLIRILSRRNEPVPIPASMGATFVTGYNNWDRLRRSIAATNPPNEDAWHRAFCDLRRQPALFKDRFIILSSSTPYSGVDARSLHLAEEEWLRLSFLIRREHEYTHYVTKRALHSSKNRIHDELLADYAGIKATIGRFRVDWFLRFMGLESFPEYRNGGRMQNYRGSPRLTDGAFTVLQKLTVSAALNLERFDRECIKGSAGISALLTLASHSLEEIASPYGFQLLDSTHARECRSDGLALTSHADFAFGKSTNEENG